MGQYVLNYSGEEIQQRLDKINELQNQINSTVSKSTLLERTYPIGSIYMSISATSPASLFGGTWEQILGCFLLAASGSYPAGSTGGEASHTLTVEEMPEHTHHYWVNVQHSDGSVVSSEALTSGLQAGGKRRYNDNTDSTGGSQPHNNMPPYLAVYMWKRTA